MAHLDFLRKYFVKRKTLEFTKTGFNQLENLVREILELRSAHFQDLWILTRNKGNDGYFVEFGGYDGITSSNTFMLEKKYGWSGIVVEPGLGFKESLISNRNCILDFRAVWDSSGDHITFKEDIVEGYLSVVSEDELVETGNDYVEHLVGTITLLDLLVEHDAPYLIDYISVDIEGSELRVLREFFAKNSKYSIKCWTVEHNFRIDRDLLKTLFVNNGYKVVNEELSYRDYWFIKED